MKEFDFIKSLRIGSNRETPEGIGDDAALFDNRYLIAKDVLVQGIHFLESAPIDFVIEKLFTCNISDIAAMGGIAKACLIGVASPDEKILSDISENVLKYSFLYGIDVIGGDTSKSKGGLFLSMTIVGLKGKNVLTRKGAGVGDIIYLSRPVGLAKLSLEKELGLNSSDICEYYHYSLKAEREVGEFLGNFEGITCACDVSDGLGRDLCNIAEESGVKARLMLEDVDLGYLKAYGVEAEKYFLSSGEEFALLFGVESKKAAEFEKEFEDKFSRKPLKIGVFERGGGCVLSSCGQEADVSKEGFEHFSKG